MIICSAWLAPFYVCKENNNRLMGWDGHVLEWSTLEMFLFQMKSDSLRRYLYRFYTNCQVIQTYSQYWTTIPWSIPPLIIFGENLNSRVFVRIFQQDESVGGQIVVKPSQGFFFLLNTLLFVLFSVFLNYSLCQQPQQGVSLLPVWHHSIIPCCSKAQT